MPGSPPRSPRQPPIARALGFLGILVLIGVVTMQLMDRRLPRYGNRSVQSWFHQFCLAEAPDAQRSYSGESEEARLAFVELGTQAIPFLVEETFRLRKDHWIRSNLHELFLHVPDWAGRGAFLPYDQGNRNAALLLRTIRPPADALLPLLEPHLQSTHPFHRYQALLALGTLADGVDTGLPHLLRALTNHTDTWAPSMAWRSIRWLGAGASNALPVVLEDLRRRRESNPGDTRWYPWLAELGGSAREAILEIEPQLDNTNSRVRIQAAATLVRLAPGHPQALRVLTAAADLGSSHRTMTDGQELLLDAVARGPRRDDPHLVSLVVPLARMEAAGWSPKGASFHAFNALERIAPERAWALLESLRQDGPDAILIAGLRLRIHRDDETATRNLVDAISSDLANGSTRTLAHLGEASASNTTAIAALDDVIAGRLKPAPRLRRSGWETSVIAQAKHALARIRYRGVRAARGLREEDW